MSFKDRETHLESSRDAGCGHKYILDVVPESESYGCPLGLCLHTDNLNVNSASCFHLKQLNVYSQVPVDVVLNNEDGIVTEDDLNARCYYNNKHLHCEGSGGRSGDGDSVYTVKDLPIAVPKGSIFDTSYSYQSHKRKP